MTTTFTRRFLLPLLLFGLILAPVRAFASTYGSGNYGNCAYGESCPATTTTSSGSSSGTTSEPATSTTGGEVLLNSFDNYFLGTGKDLSIPANKVIYFNLTTNGIIKKHSITISSVGKDYVDIIIDSNSIKDRLFIGDAKQYDVNQDNQNDIEITLNSITSGRADMTFRALETSTDTKSPSIAKVQTTKAKTKNYAVLIISIVLILLGIGLLILLARRRRKRNQNQS